MILMDEHKILSKLQYKEDDLIFLSGSIIEGYGNTRSDLDAFIVTEEKRINPMNGENIFIVMIDEQPVDIEYIAYDDLLSMIQDLNTMDFTDLNACLMFKYDVNELDLLHRFLIGKPIHNQEKFSSVLQLLRKEQLIRYLIRKRFNIYDNCLNDVMGAYESRDLPTAMFGVKALLNIGMDIFLASCGDTSVSEKWRSRRLLRYAGEDSEEYKTYISYHFRNVNSEKDQGAFVEEIIEYTNELVEKVQDKMGGM